MNIYSSKRKKPTVPIITLIDILAILLIFFILTTSFKKDDSIIKINLPNSSRPTENKVDSRSNKTLIVDKEGNIFFESKKVSEDNLVSLLMNFKKNNPNSTLNLKADEKSPLGKIIHIWDSASKANIAIEKIPIHVILKK